MPELNLLDCNLVVGRRGTPRPGNDLSLEEIQAELEHAGVRAGLAYHAHAREYDPRIGNDRLSEAAAQHPWILPCYVLLPHHTGEFSSGDALLRYLADGGARAVRLFPKDHSYGLGETWCGDLFSALEEAGVPVLIDLDQTDWREIDQVLAAYPRLALVLLRTTYRIDRWVYPLLEKYPGLRLEIAFYPLHGGIEAIVEQFGAERLVFGTGLPVWDAGAPLSLLQYAQISEEAREKIAGGNLAEILWKETAPPREPSPLRPAEGDPIWSRVRSGGLLDDLLIIDAHAHMGPWHNFHIPGPYWAEGMVAAMDASGIDRAIVAPHVGIGPDEAEGNELAAEAVQRFPDRLSAYCTINPHRTREQIVSELERCFEKDGFVGIKIHPSVHQYPANGERYRPMWEFAHERKLPVLSHTWEADSKCGPALFEAIGAEFPDAKIVLGHSGATVAGIEEAIEAAWKQSNLYLDLTKSLMHRGMLERMVEAVGADRVLFGTDLPFIGCTAQIGYVAGARVSEEDKKKIFGLNAQRIFGL